MRPPSEGAEVSLPLEHIKVIDLARVRSGPTCVRQLADMGADVVQVTEPQTGPPPFAVHGSDYQNVNRNKRSISLDLKHPQGVEVLKQLVARADVLVENYRPDVKRRLGIDYQTMSKVNPRLVYGSLSGFGEVGPYRDRPGYDQVAQGMGGLMSITGAPGEGPMRAGIPVADLTSGLFLAQGILVALLERERSGRGQWVTTSLLQSMVHMLDFQATRWLVDREVPPQAGNDHPTTTPTGVFHVADGAVNIAATTQAMFERLCEVLGVPDAATDERFSAPRDRSRNRAALRELLEAQLAAWTAEEAIDRLNAVGVPAGAILDVRQVFEHPQVQALGLTDHVKHPSLGHLELLGTPYTLSRTPGGVRSAAPDPGEHTDEVLAELGYDEAARETLRVEGVI
ncbi:MAG: CoA transferase [Dehalococcoidia bacterium]|nr:CoA transferase [Dehalococcoidia bacterium]